MVVTIDTDASPNFVTATTPTDTIVLLQWLKVQQRTVLNEDVILGKAVFVLP